MKRMNIFVTAHAIKRYRERLFDYASPDEKVVRILESVTRNGRTISLRPHSYNKCSEVKFHGISIVQIKEANKTLVITCLGDDKYRKWANTQSFKQPKLQRLLYPQPVSHKRNKKND